MKNCDINADGVKKYDKTFGSGIKAEPQKYMHEHDTAPSRTLGCNIEIGMGPHGSSLVPANPFASIAQQKFFHANPEKVGGNAIVEEFDKATNFKKLPKKVKSKK